MAETMTERFQFRLTPKLLDAITRKSERLGLTQQSIVRMGIAIFVCDTGENFKDLAGESEIADSKENT